MTTTRTRYNKSKIMRNAWYLKKSQPSMTFSACLRKAWRIEKQMIMTARIEGRTLATAPTSACLRKAWRNEKLAVMTAIIENRPMEESKVAEWHPLANVPADYYGNSRTYYGD